jgi:streptogrisin C
VRTTPLIGIAGSLALVGGLIVGATALNGGEADEAVTTSADSEPASPDDLVSALADSLDITPESALDLMELQYEAAETESELRTELGEAFGGAVFDSETRELTVHVTDSAAVDEVVAAGAEAELVDHGQDELSALAAELDAVEETADDAVTGWYIDIEENSVVVETLDGGSEAAEELLADAGVDTDAVQVAEGAEQPELYQDIIGGEYYRTGAGTCSVGFAVEGGFVTAGHCGGVGTSTTGPDGTVAGSVFPGADMAWVETGSSWNPAPLVSDHSGGTVTVTGHEEASVGSEICRSGGTTGWHCGTIEATDQTVRYPEGTVNGLTGTNACAEPGDSGGSWLAGTEAQGVTSGGSGNCSTGGVTFFQPLNPILDEWGLTLITG